MPINFERARAVMLQKRMARLVVSKLETLIRGWKSLAGAEFAFPNGLRHVGDNALTRGYRMEIATWYEIYQSLIAVACEAEGSPVCESCYRLIIDGIDVAELAAG
jgi:hypothetical protein